MYELILSVLCGACIGLAVFDVVFFDLCVRVNIDHLTATEGPSPGHAGRARRKTWLGIYTYLACALVLAYVANHPLA